MEFGTKIARLRTEHDMSQEELADQLFVSRDLVSKWENNKRRPDRMMIQQICEIFSVKENYFESIGETLARELSRCIPKGDVISTEEFPKILNEFLLTLPDRERNIFVRRYYFMETPAQIGEKYVINKANVRVILSRTRKKFTTYLKGKEGLI